MNKALLILDMKNLLFTKKKVEKKNMNSVQYNKVCD